jgi:hypothetical protein
VAGHADIVACRPGQRRARAFGATVPARGSPRRAGRPAHKGRPTPEGMMHAARGEERRVNASGAREVACRRERPWAPASAPGHASVAC